MTKQSLSRLSQYPVFLRLGVFIFTLLVIWVPVAGPIYFVIASLGGTPDSIRNTASILTLLLLYTEFIWLVRFWGRRVYGQPDLLWRYGLEFTRRSGLELLTGLAIGVFSLFALFGTQGIWGWVVWKVPSASFLRILLEGGLVSLGLGFAEELLFRGWLLDELQRDYRPGMALWMSAGIYAALHFIKPLEELLRTIITFPALLLLGATLVWAKRSRSSWEDGFWRGRLGLPIGLHAGLVWGYYIVNVGQLIEYSNQAPAWITGIDRNPLAGIMGLLFLTLLFLAMKRQAVKISC